MNAYELEQMDGKLGSIMIDLNSIKARPEAKQLLAEAIEMIEQAAAKMQVAHGMIVKAELNS